MSRSEARPSTRAVVEHAPSRGAVVIAATLLLVMAGAVAVVTASVTRSENDNAFHPADSVPTRSGTVTGTGAAVPVATSPVATGRQPADIVFLFGDSFNIGRSRRDIYWFGGADLPLVGFADGSFFTRDPTSGVYFGVRLSSSELEELLTETAARIPAAIEGRTRCADRSAPSGSGYRGSERRGETVAVLEPGAPSGELTMYVWPFYERDCSDPERALTQSIDDLDRRVREQGKPVRTDRIFVYTLSSFGTGNPEVAEPWPDDVPVPVWPSYGETDTARAMRSAARDGARMEFAGPEAEALMAAMRRSQEKILRSTAGPCADGCGASEDSVGDLAVMRLPDGEILLVRWRPTLPDE